MNLICAVQNNGNSIQREGGEDALMILILRTLLIYVMIIAAMRLMGKRQIGELQPSELVSTILLSNLASIPIESPEIPLLSSILPIFLIVCLEILVTALYTRSHRLASMVSGYPKIIVRSGVIDQQILRELRFTVDDLLASLRAKDIFRLEEVDLALVETNGSVSVFTAQSSDGAKSASDKKEAKRPTLPLIIDGCISRDAAAYCGVDPSWLKGILRKEGVGQRDILLMLCSDDKEYTIIKKQ